MSTQRYSVSGKNPQTTFDRCRQIGASDIKIMKLLGQVFCSLNLQQKTDLETEGFTINSVKKTSVDSTVEIPNVCDETSVELGEEDLSLTSSFYPQFYEGLNLHTIYAPLRVAYRPELDGSGLTVAVLDTGIRETHESLIDKVIHSVNCTSCASTSDIFGHGTGVAFCIAGEADGKSGVAPGAKIMNIKVIGDDGSGTEEDLVEGIETVCELVDEALQDGLHFTDPMYPNIINLSLGSEDDGNENNPLRLAVRVARRLYGLEIIAAAGNQGPKMTTILSPACDGDVIAVGAINYVGFDIWEQSSRGPTMNGLIKPDLICWGDNILVAGHESDTSYTTKSGTSFSCPIIAGTEGIIQDFTRRAYGVDVLITYYDWLQYAYAYCVKPEQAPREKDNAFGYGVPALGNMVQRLSGSSGAAGTVSVPTDAIVQMMPLIMIMSMMSTIMK